GLFTDTVSAEDINLISVPKIDGELRVTARIRYRQKEQPATLTQEGEDRLKVVFDEPQRAVTKGQSLVIYQGDTVLGGGTII
nr:tRNA 2-thiouridine(34) synthase MnmA [Lachnospiraceae bacterium]